MRAARLPVCRLRTGLLLPLGEIEVAERGNRPGAGAIAALERAGDDGSVLVAYENEGGGLHGIGVLARVRRMPIDGVRLWSLRGVRRAVVEADRISGDEPPYVQAMLLDDRREDAASAPPEMQDALDRLMRAWSGGNQWRAAFSLMSRSPLGQWATSLGTLLPGVDATRFDPLDHPERLPDVVRAQLTRLGGIVGV